jgi:RimJ/RimL family protein N-acetyltransferase
MTESPFLVGEKVLLRAVTDADVTDQYVAWLSDQEVTRFMGWRGFPSARHQVAEYVRSQEADDTLFLAIVSRQDQAHVGNIHLGPIDWVHRRAELAMILGDKAAWGKGYMTEAFELVIRHAFHTLNLHKLKAGTEAGNAAAIRVFHKTGWIEEGRLRQETFRDGEFRDLMLFARFKDE